MVVSPETWGSALAELRGQAGVLVAALRAAAEAMGCGAPVPEDLPEQISAYGERFRDLRQRATAVFGWADPPTDLDGFERRIQEESAAHREQAQAVLRCARGLRAVLESKVSLEAVHAQAQGLLDSGPEGAELDQLAQGTHPLALLLALVERSGELDSEQYLATLDAVIRAFGPAIAVAAVRGQLHVGTGLEAAEPPGQGGPAAGAASTEAAGDGRGPQLAEISTEVAQDRDPVQIQQPGPAAPPAVGPPPAGDLGRSGAEGTSSGDRPLPGGKHTRQHHGRRSGPSALKALFAPGSSEPRGTQPPEARGPAGTEWPRPAPHPPHVGPVITRLDLKHPEAGAVPTAASEGPAQERVHSPGPGAAKEPDTGGPSTVAPGIAPAPGAPSGPTSGDGRTSHPQSPARGERVQEQGSTEGAEAAALEPAADEPSAMAPRVRRADSCRRVWALVSEGHLGLAYHLARALEGEGGEGTSPTPVPSALLRLLAAGPFIQSPYGELVAAVGQVGLEETHDPALTLLAWAAAARPGLLAPETGATEILAELRFGEGFSRMSQLTTRMATVGETCRGLNVTVIRGTEGLAAWRQEVEAIRREAEECWAQARRATMLCASASSVWQEWIAPGGMVAALLQPIVQDSQERAGEVGRRAEELGLGGSFSKRKVETERWPGRRVQVESRALHQLHGRLHEVAAVAKRWADAVARRPEQPDFIRRQVDGLRQDMADAEPDIQHELREALRSGNIALQAAARCADRALEDLIRLFGGPAEGEVALEPASRVLLCADLLRYPQLDLDQDWLPEGHPDACIALLSTQEPRGWRDAFEARLDRHDLEGAGRIVEVLRDQGAAEADELGRKLERELAWHREWLEKQLIRAQDQVEEALVQRLITEPNRSQFQSRLVGWRGRLSETRRFGVVAVELERFSADLTELRAQGLAGLNAELASLEPGADPTLSSQIREALDHENIVAARELLLRARAGERPLSTVHAPSAFDTFFPDGLSALEARLRDAGGFGPFLEQIRDGGDLAGLPHASLAPEQLESAMELLEVWAMIHMGQRVYPATAERILRALGFQVRDMRISQRAGGVVEIDFQAEPLTERAVCPVPAFGSQVEGRYRVLCNFKPANVEELLNLVGETAPTQRGTLVFHFGRLGLAQRRDLASLCRERHRTFLVVDNLLILFLAGQTGLRLPALFACTLPFTDLVPYSATSSLVPPEMFFGRRQEVQRLIDPSSCDCFVYGGRQLGKTALLREARRHFHRPEEGRWALWIDLKGQGIGTAQGPEWLWPCLQGELSWAGIPLGSKQDPNPDSPGWVDRFQEALLGWFLEDPRRRLLLLLDEADGFLEEDGRQRFVQSSRLKNLMDRTERRLKIVFAGLHNVLRTTQQANHPLAHLGEPINVGPLLHNGNWDDARALVQDPLAMSGYRFASQDLVVRVLGHCNFYPSLVQLYCGELVHHLTDPHLGGVLAQGGPPYTISAAHLDAVYRDPRLRAAIHQKFQLTLQLDQRYEVIAYLIAQALLNDADQAAAGLPLQWIRQKSLECWREGFANMADHELSILLEEMEGLGVLQRLPTGRYTLRSPNVVPLMGTGTDIEGVLGKDRELPPTFDPATFRARPQHDASSPQRHPLTFEQERILRRERNPHGRDERGRSGADTGRS